MSNDNQAISITKGRFTLKGKIIQDESRKGISGLKIIAWDFDKLSKNDLLGQDITNENGEFVISFSRKQFSWLFDRKPDVYFEIFEGNKMIKSTIDEVIKNADEKTPPIIIPLSILIHQNLSIMNSIPPNQCTVFVQVWADVNGMQQGSTNGCYAVCNRSQQSTGEGTANLTTKVITGSNVCWSVVPIDPQYNGDFTITGVGVESGWSTPPQPVPNHPNWFTGRLTTSTVGGNVNSNIQFSFNGNSESITITLPVTITPVES